MYENLARGKDIGSKSTSYLTLRKNHSIQSIGNVRRHYKEFKQALKLLKMSIEELWRIEGENIESQIWREDDKQFLSQKFQPKISSVFDISMSKEKLSNAMLNEPVMQQSLVMPVNGEKLALKKRANVKFAKNQSLKRTLKRIDESKLSHNKHCAYKMKKALLHLKFRCPNHKRTC
ncbi:unnamed protein product [Didymodactylos carnosus]|uniref:Uncharacterized protein n=1 Tax=Didymodactylos carnosus TaxID=1234261 RepID=A0A813Y2C0_9BILA|nr:unnamed protein product [Didymodactylos carnosus]CAF1422733.1 unnamed protein product [Didymodactylos carnosus]CAF3661031.1 unnamed protein product [Didymodactylos carnosus]CAF4223021.1 unnamed protein product [Didymodactylos carnosus]